MHSDLRRFLSQVVGTIVLVAAAVMVTAFVSIPLALERYPGDVTRAVVAPAHMT